MRNCPRKGAVTEEMNSKMMNPPIANDRLLHEAEAIKKFLESPNEELFVDLFQIFTPQLIAFFRSRGCEIGLSEDLTQEVMLTVYRKARQIRDRALFRAWLFKIAHNALCRHYGKQSRRLETIDFGNIGDRLLAASNGPSGTPAFEFHHWMALLESCERETLILRFVEEWQYHEIAAAKAIPIGTVQWRVFNAKKKLAPHLKAPDIPKRKVA
jgi:RNA polymerase sigma factor (sigma-70 family)